MADSKKYNGSTWEHSLRKLTTATDTLTSLPADLYADGTNATVGLVGNMSQTGTPTPQNPIQPQETGERTENLFDGQLQQGFYAYVTGDYTLADTYVCTHLIPCTENTTYTFRCINTGGGSKNYGFVFFDSAQNRIDSDYINVLTEGDVVTHTATTPQNTAFLAINIAYGRLQPRVVRPSDITDFMLNSGSTAKPYEPYGYKIPISSGGVTTNIYLGSTQTTRQIKKYVVTGDEDVSNYDYDYQRFLLTIPTIPSMGTRSTPIICTHYIGIYDGRPVAQVPMYAVYTGSDTDNSVLIKTDQTTDRSTFIAWLQEQYANGTPVTILYALSTPETAVVNEPLRKIGDYADAVSGITIPTITGKDTFDVETTLKPSEVSLTYTGWHDASVKEWDGSEWS